MDRETKYKYTKAKFIVRKWEKEFENVTSCTPTKADIKKAPTKIKEAYRVYWKLKTSILESTLSDILVDENAKDCFTSSNETATDISISKPSDLEDSVCYQPLCDTTLTQSFSGETASQSLSEASFQENVESEPFNFKNLICHTSVEEIRDNKDKPTSNSGKNVSKPLNSKGVWGAHLNNDKPQAAPNIRKLEAKSLSMQYAQKLFHPDKFKNFNKKNPRKPRVFQKSKTTGNLLSEKPKFDIPKFEFFGTQDGGCSQSVSNSKEPPGPIIGEGAKTTMIPLNKEALIEHSSDKFKIVSKVNTISGGNAVSLLQKNMDEGGRKASSSLREVDSAWIERIQREEIKKIDIMSQDSGLELSQGLSTSQPGSENLIDSDSEDLIYDSDSESQTASNLSLIKCNTPTSLNNSQISGCSLPLMNLGKSVQVEPVGCTPEYTLVKPLTVETSVGKEPASVKKTVSDAEFRPEELFKGPLINCKAAKRPSEQVAGELPASKKIKRHSDAEEPGPVGTLPEIAAASAKRTSRKKTTESNSDPQLEKKLALLEKKLQTGKANENFVAINIQKKVFVRGKKGVNFSKYKKQQWKQLKQQNGSYSGARGVLKCFKCGDVGHFSKACPSDKGLLPLEDYESDDESAFPTLDEMVEIAKEAGEAMHNGKRKFSQPSNTVIHEGEPVLVTHEVDQTGMLENVIQPPYQLREDGSIMETPQEVFDCLRHEFGHTEFLEGQQQAVMRILSGKSTLVTLSTGSGKSLCYQLPAAIYAKHNPGCITLVISPLVSLMEDQVGGAGGWEKTACYHTYMTQKKREKVLERLRAREFSVLLVSPETLVSLEAGAGKQLLSALPPIAFACIDEAHCLHQWCHNFRPSYLMVTRVLRERFGIRTLLGLTATASSGTVQSLMGHLGIDPEDEDSLIKDTPLPDNLVLSVSVTCGTAEKQEALLKLLTDGCFSKSSSTIIYCTRRETCDQVAGFLRTALQLENGNNKRGRLSLEAEVYHAGLTAGRRNQVQKAFMSGKLRIVVATVAFGMGINKPDIRGVIHYSMPSSFENYVQEVGRAGRDRLPARCHLFLDSQNEDLGELRRHIYCNTIDRFVIRKLLQLVFIRCECPEGATCPKHEVAFPIDTTVADLDLPQENISTLLAYLELHQRKWIKTLPLVYTKCKVSSYKGPNHLKSVCKKCPPLAMVLADAQLNSKKPVTSLEFDVFEIARKINWDSGVLKKTIKNVEWTHVNEKPAKSGIMVEFSSLGFRLLAPGNLPDEELDFALDVLNKTVQNQEKTQLKGLQAFYSALSEVSYEKLDAFADEEEVFRRSANLKEDIRNYFTDQKSVDAFEMKTGEVINESSVIDDIRQLISSSKGDHVLTGRSIARIFHGIGSPNFPPIVWGRTRFWRLHMNQDFNALCKLATQQLLLFR